MRPAAILVIVLCLNNSAKGQGGGKNRKVGLELHGYRAGALLFKIVQLERVRKWRTVVESCNEGPLRFIQPLLNSTSARNKPLTSFPRKRWGVVVFPFVITGNVAHPDFL